MAYKFNPLISIGLDDTGNDADAAAGGSDTQVQYNSSGALAGSADLTWDDSAKELGVGGDINLDDGGTYETTVQVVTPTANRTISFPDATGTVALVAGSSGQVTYNDAGAQAGLTSASIGSTGEINISLAGAASTPPVSFTGSWFTGGTATTTKPQLLIEPTGTTSTAWSTSGTGLGVNAASGFSGRLLDLQTNGTSRMVVQGDGKLLVGTSSSTSNDTLVLQGNSSGSNGGSIFRMRRGEATPADGSTLGVIKFEDNGGGTGGEIQLRRDGGTWTSGSSHPGRLEFSTTADGASSPTERMRITEGGNILISQTAASLTTGGAYFYRLNGLETFYAGFSNTTTGGELAVVYINRQGSDGSLIEFRQANATEGSISVSGTTISYNGAHLSRWSQLPGGAERTEILRGTVLSNIDEMCAWGKEDNEQLNRMQVSDVEGDPNVAGVFQDWDNDDTFPNDFYCAMTGDFIIRIAEGVIVQRGDLLMSAGDGTAKPQDDDIIRSKTVAKVTSTHVTCTYDDGSYCVPCVLMAC